MTPSVHDNIKYRCNECGTEMEFPNHPFDVEDCPTCGRRNWEQLMITQVCDFCSNVATGERWRYPCKDFRLKRVPGAAAAQGFRGDWLACQACHKLIAAGDLNGLAARSIEDHPDHADLTATQRRMAIRAMRPLFDAFTRHRTGEPVKLVTLIEGGRRRSAYG